MAAIRDEMEQMVRGVQDQICAAVEELDGSSFREDKWDRPQGGGGISRVLENGAVFEKAGVNTSVVFGTLSPAAARSMAGGKFADVDRDLPFYATGVSVVIHPHNPMAPTAHCNYRYFEIPDESSPGTWWFGGGADLTPSYLFNEDATHFHSVHRDACDRHGDDYYRRFKSECDDYFLIPHRQERRGVGGIFFEYQNDRPPQEHMAFSKDCAESFVPAYIPLVAKRAHAAFSPEQKSWQALRRGRYVEFNLVYDRGTTFGLRTGGRVESILMSLPAVAGWKYDHVPPEGSEENRLVEVLKNPREWV